MIYIDLKLLIKAQYLERKVSSRSSDRHWHIYTTARLEFWGMLSLLDGWDTGSYYRAMQHAFIIRLLLFPTFLL